MKSKIVLSSYPFLFLLCIMCSCKEKTVPITSVIIPQPLSLTISDGVFNIPEQMTVSFESITTEQQEIVIQWLADIPTREDIAQQTEEVSNHIFVSIKNDSIKYPTSESYSLNITPQKIIIEACNTNGLFYAVQSLLQLYNSNNKQIICQTITDTPQFPYRGLLLDASSHYLDIQFIKKQIDAMAYYKMNKLILYVTGDGGWRIEINDHPWLTQKAAWRQQTKYSDWKNSNDGFCPPTTKDAYGGTYSKKDIQNIVEYAQNKFIEIIPALEMPCDINILRDTYINHIDCNNRKNHSSLLIDIVDKTIDMFSAKNIYIGNGSTSGSRATNCIPCLPRVGKGSDIDLTIPHNAAIRNIEHHLNRQGVKLFTWESAIRAGIDPNYTSVVAWHETEEGIAATQMNYEVVMSPASHFSLDYYQSNPSEQSEAMSGFLPLEMIYNYNLKKTDTKNYILGAQANMWTQYTSTTEEIEKMLYPRLLAIAEVSWSRASQKSYLNFKNRAILSSKYLQEKGYHIFDLKNEQVVRPKSIEPLVSLAKNKPITYNSLFDERFPASGKLALADGERGGWSYTDGRWQGFQNIDMDITVDLGTKQPIKRISSTFIYNPAGNIFLPYHIEILTSDDGTSYKLLDGIANQFHSNGVGYALVPFEWNGNSEARYIRYIAKYNNRADGWLFTDEIIVN